jgi:hypothetical protein
MSSNCLLPLQPDTLDDVLGQFLRFFYLLNNSILILFPLVLNQLVLSSHHPLQVEQLILQRLRRVSDSLRVKIVQKLLVLHLVVFV